MILEDLDDGPAGAGGSSPELAVLVMGGLLAGISGAKGRDERPAFDKLHRANHATRDRRGDGLVGRSAGPITAGPGGVVGRAARRRLRLYLDQQGVDTTTPAGRALFQMLGVFAEFERAIIVERVRAGVARAKAEGKHLGRPRINGETEQAIRAALAEGRGIRKVARECGVGVSEVQRVKASAG